MELALFDPEVGYYTHATSGPGGAADYVTSPEIHGAFGALIASQLEELWRFLGQPDPFWLIEGGPGTGRFAADILLTVDAAYPSFARALHLALIERNPRLIRVQHDRLTPWSGQVIWLDPDPQTWRPLGSGCVFANELLDAFPVHRLVGTPDGVAERFVTTLDGRLAEIQGELSNPALSQQIRQGGGDLPPGSLGEVSLEAPAWVARASRLIDRGYLLLIDYGEPAASLYGPRHPAGTLRAYRQQARSGDVLATPGLQDLTAHIDLAAATRAALSGGMNLIGATQQSDFLDRLGLLAMVEQVDTRFDQRSEQHAHRKALYTLWNPEELGGLAVLIFGNDAPSHTPVGFGSGESGPAPSTAAAWRLADT